MKHWKAKNAKPSFLVDFKKKAISKQEQLFNMKIGNLIGFGLYQFDYLKDQELDTFRRRAERLVPLLFALFSLSLELCVWAAFVVRL